MLKDFISLFFPDVCLACGEGLSDKEKYVCSTCLHRLPKTNYHTIPDNPMFRNFAGRVDIKAGAAYSFYGKGSVLQKLVHHVKYKGKKELAVYFGKWYGHSLKDSSPFSEADYIIPVPLHPKKQRQRGYNQSACIAGGLSKVMGIPILTDTLKRTKHTGTQTNKSRFSRWENVKDSFTIENPEPIKNKHILLVDDVITTGATVEACINMLKTVPVASVSVVSIGYVATELV